MNIGYKISKLREERGWTQEKTATMIDISRAALSHYEKNRREPDPYTLTKLADLYNVSVDYLVGRTDSSDQTLEEPIRQFVNQLELSDTEILKKYTLAIDGKELTPEEARRFIAFVRAERSMNR